MKIWDFCKHCKNFNCPDCTKCLRETFKNTIIEEEPQRYSREATQKDSK